MRHSFEITISSLEFWGLGQKKIVRKQPEKSVFSSTCVENNVDKCGAVEDEAISDVSP